MRSFTTILLALVIGIAACYFINQRRTANALAISSGPAAVETTGMAGRSKVLSTVIRSQGKLLPHSGLLKIVGPVGERVEWLTETPVGGIVNTSDVLVKLQSRKLRKQDLLLAKARLLDARQKIGLEQTQADFKLQSARLAVAEAESNDAKLASQEKSIGLLQRQQEIARQMQGRLEKFKREPATRDLVNQTEIDQQRLQVEQLDLKIEQAKAELAIARQSAKRGRQLAANRVASIEHAKENANTGAPLASLEAAVAMAEQAYAMTQVLSPIDNATILDVIVRQGDAITNQPIMILGDTSKMHCVAEVNDLFTQRLNIESDGEVRATITSPALPDKLTGIVIARGGMISPPSLKDPNPFGASDRRVSTVTILLDDPDLASKFVNLQVDVEILVGSETDQKADP